RWPATAVAPRSRAVPGLAAGLEHLEHALGDHVAAGGVARSQQHRDEADGLLERGVGVAEHDHGADQHDAVDEVGAGHQRRVQDHRHPRDDHVPGDRREHEYVQGDEALRHHRIAHSQPPRHRFDAPIIRGAGGRRLSTDAGPVRFRSYAADRDQPRRQGPARDSAGRGTGYPGPRGLPGRGRSARVPVRRGLAAPPRGRARRGPGRHVADAPLRGSPCGGMVAAVLAGAAQPDRGHAAAARLPPALAVARRRRRPRAGLGGRRSRPGTPARGPRGLDPAGRGARTPAATTARGLHVAGAGGTGCRRHRPGHGLQRGLREDAPVARPPGAAAGTGGLDMTHREDAFDARAREAHRAALHALSPAVRAQLRRRTRLALAGEAAADGAPATAPRWGWIAAPAMALALAFALPWPGAQDTTPSAPVAVAPAPEMELAAPLEQDPDFYLWLASADAVALAA